MLQQSGVKADLKHQGVEVEGTCVGKVDVTGGLAAVGGGQGVCWGGPGCSRSSE